jgi:hypothetical protein
VGIGPKEQSDLALIGKVGLLGLIDGRTYPGYTVAKAGLAQHGHMARPSTGAGPIRHDTRACSEWYSTRSGAACTLGACGGEPAVT